MTIRGLCRWSGIVLLIGGTTAAILLPPRHGTCGLPPFGTDEFCRGKDFSVKLVLLTGSVTLTLVLLALARFTRGILVVASVIVVLGGIGAAAAVADRISCPDNLHLNYYIRPDHAPLCTPVESGQRVGSEPAVDRLPELRWGLRAAAVALAAGLLRLSRRAPSGREVDDRTRALVRRAV
jgi:hypothetical protein